MAGEITNEGALQAICFQWHWNTYPAERRMLFHVQNKAKNKIEGSRFKAMGVVKGVSDFVYIARSAVHFIELKTKTEQSDEQVEFETKVKARGHSYHVVRNFGEFKKLILCLQGLKN